MQISISGKQLAVGAALRGHIETHLRDAVAKYFDQALEAHVVVSRSAHNVRVDITTQAARNIQVQAHGEAADPYIAYELAADRIAKRLRRTKRLRVKGRRNAAESPAQARKRRAATDEE
jgi:ribosomal subunit interface protein